MQTIKTTKANWQKTLANSISDPAVLLAKLKLNSPTLLAKAQLAHALFPLRITHSYVNKIQKGEPNDPLLRQILPLSEELVNEPGYVNDPLEENNFNPVPGLLHKYHGRVLIMLTSACAIHCRYCFRRAFPYDDHNLNRNGWPLMLDYLQKDQSITEVILSGGDPLVVSNAYLRAFGDELVKISHIKRLRIHSRLPVVLPERMDAGFVDWFSKLALDSVLVIHTNHPNEIDNELKQALAPLKSVGVTLLNQSVVLRGVNDDAGTLARLSEKLFSIGVLPYYLHTFDKVRGAAHFDLPLHRVQSIYAQLLKILPGYLIPKLVCEKPGEVSKTRL